MSKKNKANLASQPAVESQSKMQVTENQIDTNSYKWFWICIGVLVVSVFIAFSGGFNNEFVNWDDQNYVYQNPMVKNPNGHWETAWNSHVALNYHPITMTSLMINSTISGIESARSFIITNTIIHLLNVLLVFWIVLLLLKNKSEIVLPKAGKPLFVAFVTALLFAIHPMRVESVAWVSERKDVLYSFFFLAACINYLKYLDAENNRKYLIYCFLLFIASCLSKGQAVVLPIVFLLLDYWRDRKFEKSVFVEKMPFLAISLLFGLIAVSVQGGGNFGGLLHVEGIAGTALNVAPKGSIFSNILYAGYGFMMYCYHLIIPAKLSSLYPYRAPEESHPEYFLGFLIMLMVVGVGVFNYGRNKVIAFGIGFFLITIALVLQLLQVGGAIMADRYTYLPYIGFFFIISTFLWNLYQKQGFQKKLAIGIISLFSILCIFLTRKQVETWQDSEALFSQRVKLEPDDYRAYYNLGEVYMAKENPDGVITNFNLAIEKGWKETNTPWLNLAVAYEKKNDYPKAIENYNYMILKEPSAEVYLGRGNAYLNAQQPEKALPDLEKALNMPKNKDLKVTRGSLATAQLNTAKYKEALENYNIVIDKEGVKDNPEYYYNRGVAKTKFGDNQGALADIKQCVTLKPDHVKANQALKLFGVK